MQRLEHYWTLADQCSLVSPQKGVKTRRLKCSCVQDYTRNSEVLILEEDGKQEYPAKYLSMEQGQSSQRSHRDSNMGRNGAQLGLQLQLQRGERLDQ